jgi:hypothetical protein
MMKSERRDPPPVLGSITSAFGLALGELLLTLGSPEELGNCLTDIHIAAEGTMLSSYLARPAPQGEKRINR